MIPLHTIVAAVRQHPPTKDVVVEWLARGPDRWFDNRDYDSDITADAARLIVEACLWNYCAKNHIQVVWSGDQWCKPVMRAFNPLGTDLAAALAFACGVPVPDKETQ